MFQCRTEFSVAEHSTKSPKSQRSSRWPSSFHKSAFEFCAGQTGCRAPKCRFFALFFRFALRGLLIDNSPHKSCQIRHKKSSSCPQNSMSALSFPVCRVKMAFGCLGWQSGWRHRSGRLGALQGSGIKLFKERLLQAYKCYSILCQVMCHNGRLISSTFSVLNNIRLHLTDIVRTRVADAADAMLSTHAMLSYVVNWKICQLSKPWPWRSNICQVAGSCTFVKVASKCCVSCWRWVS